MTATIHDVPALTLCEIGRPDFDSHESFSPFCLKVHRALRVAGLPYASRHGNGPRAFKHLNKAGQVPVLLVGDRVVNDSTEILREIERLVPGSLSRGLDFTARQEAALWEEFADTALNNYVIASRWADDDNWSLVRVAYFGKAPALVRKLLVPKLRKRVIETLVARDVWRAGRDSCWRRLEDQLDALDAVAPRDRGFWLGDDVTAADVALFGQLWSLNTPLTARQQASLQKRASLFAYLTRVHEATRPSSSSSSSSQSPGSSPGSSPSRLAA